MGAMTPGLRLFTFIGIILVSLLGLLLIFEIIPFSELQTTGGKLVMAFVLLGLTGWGLAKVSGRQEKSKDPNQNQKQGPRF